MCRRRHLHIVVGTRPEAVKVAPLALALAHSPDVDVQLIDVGQQPGRVAEALAPFGLAPDHSLHIHRHTGNLAELGALVATSVDAHLAASRADAVLVQGDTSTALMAGLVCYWRRLPLIHLEAGLRTLDLDAPFPEEGNRAMLGRIAALHLAPTPGARRALAAEGISGDRVVVTGNTVVDALSLLLGKHPPRAPEPGLVTVTVHRREAWGAGVAAVCEAVRRTIDAVSHARFVVVTHPNPAVAAQVHAALDNVDRVRVVEPMPYDKLLSLLQRSEVVLTDSGGIQEEAPSLGLPALVARGQTERPEAVQAGSAILVGLDVDTMTTALVRLLTDEATRKEMAAITNPFGDGRAAERCAQAIRWLFGHCERPPDWTPRPC